MNTLRRLLSCPVQVAAAAIVVASWSALAALDGETRPIVIEPSEPSLDDSPYAHNWKCKTFANCPAGGVLREPSGKYAGCKKVIGFSGCIGECRMCTGSTSSVDLCVTGEYSDSCSFLGATPGQNVNCGTTTYMDDCVYAATPPAGEPFATPNSCYCGGTPRASTDPCIITPCTNPL